LNSDEGSATLPAQGLAPSAEQILRHLRRAVAVSRRASELGHHPFGAILVGPDQESVLMEQCNVDTVNHAESTLARMAASHFTPQYLWGCTLYTSVEPCCMCSGTAYWANIGRVVFGMSEQRLLAETGDYSENPTMSVAARYVFDHGQKPVIVIGPVAQIVPEVLAMHRAYWVTRRSL
jgi:tRNA(Arg) A34 adenosine deaminase TadA